MELSLFLASPGALVCHEFLGAFPVLDSGLCLLTPAAFLLTPVFVLEKP
jgi:hypothetical protein